MSVLCRKSRAHCSTKVERSAHVRLSARLMNHRELHSSDVSAGRNGVERVCKGRVSPEDRAASCRDT
jgi:hypothetical protein